MGKATRWLKGLLGMKEKKDHCDNLGSLAPHKKEKKRRSFTKSGKDHEVTHISPNGVKASESDDARLRSYVAEQESEQNKHAIAVAAATAAAADAAVAAAHAAMAVVRLTSHGRGTLFSGSRERWAAVKIQSFFRGYLARKALRALKGLVKIQALVRGYLVRKRAAATLHSMQALLRAQVAVRSQRSRRSTSRGSSRFQPQTPARKYMQWFDETRSEFHSKRLATSYETSSFNINGFDESPKIVEIDTYRPRSRSRRITTTLSESGEDHLHYQAISVVECRNPQHLEWYLNADEFKSSTAHSTPRLANAPATPLRSVCGDPPLRPYCNSPNYMANTQSYKAKLRSHSAPKQRPDPKKRISLNEIMAARNSTSGIRRPWSSKPESQEYCFFDKVGYSGQLENQKENFRRN